MAKRSGQVSSSNEVSRGTGERFSLFTFSDQEGLARNLAMAISSLLSRKIEDRGRAGLVVSGGRTPVSLFEALSRQDIDWSRVLVTLVDERWVPTTSKNSNQALVEAHLLKNRAKKATFLGLFVPDMAAKEAEKECSRRLKEAHFPFDVLVLGMGADGHTASLFPGAEGLREALEPASGQMCKAVRPKDAPFERMTLTLPAILSAENIFLHIVGRKKMEAFKRALEDGSSIDMPIRYVLRRAWPPLKVYWAP